MRAVDAPSQSHWTQPPRVFSLMSKDTQHIEALNDLDFLTVAFRPVSREPFYLETEGVHGNAITLWRTSAPFGFVSTPKYALDKMTIRFVHDGSIARVNHDGRYVARPGKAMLVAFEEMLSEQASSEFCAFTGTVDRSALLACHGALQGEDATPFPQFMSVTDVDSPPMRAFAHNFRLIYNLLQAGLDDSDLTYPLIEEMVIYQFLTAWPRLLQQDEEATAARPSWHVRRALDYIDANLQRKITLAEIAETAHIGVRSLQLCFRKELGRTPVQWILERRLEGVHKDLTSSADERISIAAIARRWGFVHMGDFSRRFRERYGFTPMEARNSGR